jgi:hypothetical protein
MPMSATGPGLQRDLRIDFFRGLALLFIFIDHVPGNDLARLTMRNFGFSDAAEVFVLLAGFSAVLAYGRTFNARGFKAGTARVLDRVRDLYAWHLGLVIVCTAGLTLATALFANRDYVRNIGVHVFAEAPGRSAVMAAALINQPNMLNILPLYIVLLLVWLPFVLWLMPRRPRLTLGISVAIWAVANIFELNLPSQLHSKGWVFNPFAWQLLITIGALAAHFSLRGAIALSRLLVWVAVTYLAFSFVMVAPWTQIAGLEHARLLPQNLLGAIDKSYLSPWRLLHVVALGYLAIVLLSPQSGWLTRAWAMGIGRCGRHSLEIFGLGTVLSFAGWVVLAEAGNGLVQQILVNAVGIGILWGMAWVLSGSNRGAEHVAFTQVLRKHFADWRSQLQRV